MSRRNVINAIEPPEGYKRATPKRNKQRRCKECGKLLSIYNDNKYCFAHTMIGFEKQLEKEENKRRGTYERNFKAVAKRKYASKVDNDKLSND